MGADEVGTAMALRGEHDDREAIEETGRGDRKVGADEAGTAMALRGEHDARSASTQEEGRPN